MDFTISYEKILGDGKIGIRVPVSFGYDFNDWDFNSIFYSGAGFEFLSYRPGKMALLHGPQLQLGIGREEYLYGIG